MPNKILVTGRPGVGKTTLVREVAASAAPLAGGFVTEEIRVSGRRTGFRVEDIVSGRRGVLAHVDRPGRPRVGRYGVDVAAFDRVGVAALRAALGREGCVVIDEIGKMELCSAAFREAVAAVMDSDRPVLATIPVFRNPFLDALRGRDDVTVVELTLSNRDALPARVSALLAAGEAG
ncbi:MAG: NTPase [Planctomycetota bacterium]